jgi:ABC-type amino acid transport substrate-binding protein
MIKRLFPVFILYCMPLSVHAADEVFNRVIKSKTINCAYAVWPPYIAKDANTGELSGINYDIMEQIARYLGFKLNWVTEVGVGDVASAMNADKADVMCATLWANPLRLSGLTFSLPTFYDVVWAYARADDTRFDGDLNKANKKEIKTAGVDGDVTADLALEKLPKATPQFLPQNASGAEAIMYVVTKKADIAFLDEALVNDFHKTNPGKLRKVAGIGPARVFGEHITVKAGEYRLRDMIDMAILQLANDGVLAQIADRYSKEYNSAFVAPDKTVTLPPGLVK